MEGRIGLVGFHGFVLMLYQKWQKTKKITMKKTDFN